MLIGRSRFAMLMSITVLVVSASSHALGAGRDSRGLLCESIFAVAPTAADKAALAEFLIRPQPVSTLVRAALQRSHGMTWQAATTKNWSFHPKLQTPKALTKAIASDPVANFTSVTSTGAAFHAKFNVMPIQYFSRELTHDLGIPETAYIFNMSLADTELATYFGGTLREFPFHHLQDSFAYIRFYVAGSDLVVTEIQSELYRYVRSKELNPAYKHWSRQILLAFEHYARKTFFPTHPEGRILIGGADYQLRRWRKANAGDGLAPDVARLLYRDLPAKLGYKEASSDLAFEWPGHLSDENENAALEPLKLVYAITSTDLANSKSPIRGAMTFLEVAGGREHAARLALAQLHRQAENPSRSRPEFSRTADFNQPAVLVDYKVLPDTLLYSSNSELKTFHQTLVSNLPSWITPFRTKTFVSLAKADASASIEDSMTPFKQELTYHHWPASDRHPLVFNSNNEILSFKGGGRRTLKDSRKLRSQVFATQETETASHQVWGGLLESQGRVEFLNHLWLHKLAHDAGFRASAAIPLDVGWMEQVPRLTKNGVEIVSMNRYMGRELNQASERIVQLRTYTRSPYRVLVIPQMLHSESVLEVLRRVLPQFYETYGEKLTWSEPKEPLVVNGKPNHAAIYSFLHQIYLQNKPAAERILTEFSKRTLTTIGFVHGLGGHLGGTAEQVFESDEAMRPYFLDEPLGAPSGGATQLRNVTLAGELRDLDNSVLIPGGPLAHWERHRDILSRNLLYFQKQDMHHWQETWYHVTSLLRGKVNPPAGIEFPTFVWGNPAEGGDIYLRPYEISPEGRARSDYLDEDMRLNTVVNRSATHLDEILKSDATDLRLFYGMGGLYASMLPRMRMNFDE